MAVQSFNVISHNFHVRYLNLWSTIFVISYFMSSHITFKSMNFQLYQATNKITLSTMYNNSENAVVNVNDDSNRKDSNSIENILLFI